MKENEVIDVDFNENINVEEFTPEGEEGIESPEEIPNKQEENIESPEEMPNEQEEKSLEDRIKEKINAVGYAYVYDGEILDESKLTFNSKTFCIFNKRTGLPFIYDGVIVRYGGKIEAKTALVTLKMYTGNNDLGLVDYEELKGKSIL